MRYFPLFIDMRESPRGGGRRRRGGPAQGPAAAQDRRQSTLVADRLHPELDGLVSHGAVAWLGTRFEAGMLDGAALVFVAADAALEAAVSAAAQARGIPVNVVDRADLSTFITPAIVDRDPLVIAIGTEGAAPVLGQGIRQRDRGDAAAPSRRPGQAADQPSGSVAATFEAAGSARRAFLAAVIFRDRSAKLFSAGDQSRRYARDA